MTKALDKRSTSFGIQVEKTVLGSAEPDIVVLISKVISFNPKF